MGEISFSTSLLITIGLLIFLIAVLPDRICLSATNCLIITPLHALKNLLWFFGSITLLYAYLGALLIGTHKIIRFLVKNQIIMNGLSFLVSFDEASYRKFMRSFKDRRSVS
jgi:hypothetical protein